VRYLKDENYKKDLQVIPLEDIKEFNYGEISIL